MSYQQRAHGWRKYLPTASTQAAFALAAGSYSLTGSAGAGYLRDNAFYTETSSSSVYRGEKMSGWRGAIFKFFGTAAENLTADYKLWIFNFEKSSNGAMIREEDVTSYSITLWCSGTITTGNTATAGIAGTSAKWVDTVTCTVSNEALALEAAYGLGNTSAYSPASDLIGVLAVPHMMDASGWILEFDMTGAASMNAEFRLTR